MRILTLICAFLLSFSADLTAQANTLWDKEYKEKVSWLSQLPDGNIIVGAKDGLYCYDHMEGNLLWEHKDKLDTEGIEYFEPTPIAATTGKHLVIFNAQKGGVIYDGKNDDARAHGNYFLDDLILVETKKGKDLSIVGITNESKTWVTKIGKAGGGGGLIGKMQELDKNGTKQRAPILKSSPILMVNTVVLFLDKNVYGLNKHTGKLTFEFKMKENVSEIIEGDGTFMIVQKKKIHGFDPATGKGLWEREFDNKVKDMQIEPSLNMAFVKDKKKLYAVNIVSGEDVYVLKNENNLGQVMISRDNKKGYISSKKDLSSFDLSTGDMKTLFEGDSDINYFRERENKLLLKTNKGVMLFDPEVGKVLWDKHVRMDGIEHFQMVDNMYLLTCDERSRVASDIILVDTNGKHIWREEVPGGRLRYKIFGKNLFVMTHSKMTMFDLQSGERVWKKDINVFPVTTYSYDTDKGILAIYSKGLHIIDLNSGTITRPKKQAGFKNVNYDEQRILVEIKDYGIFLKARQTTALTDFDGKIIYNRDYKESGKSGLAKFALGLASAASSVGGLASFSDDVLSDGQTSDRTKNLSGFGSWSSDAARKRYDLAQNSGDELMILMKFKDKTQGFADVSKETGEILNKAVFKDKEPMFLLDEVDGLLFVVEKQKKLSTFKLR